jgi:hypothetical protein
MPYYSLQVLPFVVPLAGLAVYHPLTLFDEIQGEVSEPILLQGYRDTMMRTGYERYGRVVASVVPGFDP